MDFHKDILKVDFNSEVERICSFIRQQVREMRREGAVVGLSGGIDSALAAAVCVKALGKEKVFGLILPEKESMMFLSYPYSHEKLPRPET